MKRFIVVSRLKPERSLAELAPLVQAEQARSRELRAQGVLETLYISAGMSPTFLIMRAESEAAIQAVLETYPLYPHATWEVIELREGEGPL